MPQLWGIRRMTAVELLALTGALLVAIVAGLAGGALVNTLADRVIGVDEPIWRATQCRKCLTALPPASVFALRELVQPRICPQCGKRASLRRPLTQIALALLFPLVLAHALFNPGHPLSPHAHALPLWALVLLGVAVCISFTFTFVVDLEHHLIYDLAIWPAMALILAIAVSLNLPALPALLLGGALAGGLFLLLYGLGWAIYRQEALGFGDVKLAALMGVVTAWPSVTTALAITVAGGFVAALLLLASGSKNRHAFIPFGVFMALGSVFTMLTMAYPW